MADELSPAEFERELETLATDATLQSVDTQRNAVQVAPVPGYGIANGDQEFLRRHQRIGPQGVMVPLDIETGAPFTTRLNLSFAPDSEAAGAALKNSFNGTQVEQLQSGEFILRGVMDPATGTMKDLLVDERRTSMKDFADFASVLPQLAASLIAMRRGGAITGSMRAGSLAKIGADSAIGGTAAATMAALQDASFRLGVGKDVDPLEIAKRRGVQAAADTVLGAGLGKMVSAGPNLINSATAPKTPIQQVGMAAKERLEKETGVKIRMSFGTETGNPRALMAEAIAEKSPTGGDALKAQARATEADMLAVQKALMGDGPLPDPADVGSKAVKELRSIAAAAAAGVKVEHEALAKKATSALTQAIRKSTGLSRSVLKQEAGTAVRAGVEAQEQAFRSKAAELYGAIKEDPLISVAPLKKELQAVREELVKSKRVIGDREMAAGFDAEGLPLSVVADEQGREVVREFVPDGLRRFLTGVESLDDQMPLSELRALRTQIHDAINQTEVLEGVPNRLLKKFSSATTKAIEDGVKDLDPAMAEALGNANKFYRENLPRFQVKGVLEILADPTQRKLGNFAIVNQAIRDPDQYFRLKEILTNPINLPDGSAAAAAPVEAWDLFRQAAITEMIERASLSGNGRLMSGARFMDDFAKLEPEVAKDLFGAGATSALNTAKLISALDGKVDADDFLATMRASPTTVAFGKLVDKQRKLDQLYSEGIMSKFAKGELTDVEPTEFVERFIDAAKTPEELSEVMARLSGDPQLLEDIRRLQIQKILKDSERGLEPQDVARGTDSAQLVDARDLFKVIRGDERKLRIVLGEETLNLLKDYAMVANMQSVKEGAAAAMGGLTGGTLMNSILTLDLKNIPKQFGYYFIGKTLASPSLRKIFTPGRQIDPTTAARAVIVSAPFIESVMEDFGKGPGTMVIESLGRALGLIEEDQDKRSESAPMEEADFERALQEQ